MIYKKLKQRWSPHNGQLDLFAPLLIDGTDTFGQCGRNFGKTEGVAYVLWRYAMEHPGSENYYFAPYFKQAKEILWASRRIQGFGPPEWISPGGLNNSELRITLENGSFIKLDGSDNVDAYRGIKPKGVSILDEFKDFRPEFYDAYDPNRAAHQAPICILGTPPDRECQYLDVAKEFRNNPNKHFYWGPTECNPHISREWLEAKRLELFSKGEEDVWEREYLAKYVPGGISKIFPMVTRSVVKNHNEVMHRLMRDRSKLEWWCIADPAAATVFGVLYIAYNKYNKEIFVLDEIYESDQANMTVSVIGKRIMDKAMELNPREDWRYVADEAATWFMNEMMDRFRIYFEPTQKLGKESLKKEQSLSLAKDTFVKDKVTISDRCVKFFWELDNYYKDKNGKIPKADDHLIDDYRYFLQKSFYSLNELQERETDEYDEWRERRRTIEEDFGDGLSKWERLD